MKEFLLLRNNKQTGPYTLEELKTMNLKPFDLVWHQNKSFSWKYPSEMDNLAAFVAPVVNSAVITVDSSGAEQKNTAIEKAVVSVKDSFENNDYSVAKEKETPVRYIRHVVAIKPSIDHIQVKTIKSTSQPDIVKVEMRDIPNADVNKLTDNDVYQSRNLYQTSATAKEFSTCQEPVKHIAVIDGGAALLASDMATAQQPGNKLEWMMLIIGATSLIAIVYLLLTSPY